MRKLIVFLLLSIVVLTACSAISNENEEGKIKPYKEVYLEDLKGVKDIASYEYVVDKRSKCLYSVSTGVPTAVFSEKGEVVGCSREKLEEYFDR